MHMGNRPPNSAALTKGGNSNGQLIFAQLYLDRQTIAGQTIASLIVDVRSVKKISLKQEKCLE